MSDSFLRVITTSPPHVPTREQAEAGLRLLRTIAPEAETTSIEQTTVIVLVDAGRNFSEILCPACGASLSIDWWVTQLDRCYESKFEELDCVTPCCAADTTLNDLVYIWPQGFARWRLEARGPNRSLLTPAELDALATSNGHEVREIWTHY